MAGKIGFEFKGGKELERALRELGDPMTARRIGLLALRKGAEPMRDKAKVLVPKDQQDLEQSIKIATARKSKGGDKDEVTVLIGIDAAVQPAVEVARKSGDGTYRDPGVAGVGPLQEFGADDMPANPFMRPAYDAEKNATPDRVGREMWPAIQRAAARLAKRAK